MRTATPPPASWSGTRFDGRTAVGEIVVVSFAGGVLRVVSREHMLRYRLAELGIAERFGHAPVMIALPEGATLEVRDPDGTLFGALESAGRPLSLALRLQRNRPAALLALVLLIAALVWVYVVALPVAARGLVDLMPASLDRRIGESVLAMMDSRSLRPSSLPAGRRETIARAFAAAAARSAPGVDVRLEFRAGAVNAFALPGGVIVLFDGLVALAGGDDEVLGVLGHELGHVVHRHSTRQLVQSLGVVAVASLLWGDFSSVAANAPALIGVFRYGREFEREADDYAVAYMRMNALPVRALEAMFARLEAKQGGAGGLPDFISTHPSPAERRQRLQEAVREDAGAAPATQPAPR